MRPYVLWNADFHKEVRSAVEVIQDQHFQSMRLPYKCELKQGDGPI